MISQHKYNEELKEMMRMMRPQGRALQNETQNGMVTSFPNFKLMMPPDQKAKLLEMHRSSKATAGIYVAVVLGVYLILLTLLVCRYVKRRPSSIDAASLLTAPPGIPLQTPQRNKKIVSCGSCHLICHMAPARIRTIYKSIFCCRKTHSGSMEESIHDTYDYPMTSLTTQVEFRDKERGKIKPVNV